ncbi:MAG: glutathione S-transferase family protein [Hyphomicrobiaceae bacterium]
MHLYLANKLYSSWSLRPWLLMTALGIPFEETVIPMYFPDSKARMLDVSPTGKMPCLVDGDTTVWESLAIMEYLHERFPDKGVWPADAKARAHARAAAQEMHAGFQALRSACPMNLAKRFAPRELSSDVADNVRRLEGLWADARRRFGVGGPFLYGKLCAADAMYAPVVTRLDTYQIPVSSETRRYMDAILAHPAFVKWRAEALAEPWTIDHYEEGWTAVETFHAGPKHTDHPRHRA